jgi:2-polyprenyl-3-methyl-5-hydroxy-6-metoxy-1,4-benzoquinol methylase
VTTPKPVGFSKYDVIGAYHWDECDRGTNRFNPPLKARYEAVARRLDRSKRILDVGCGDGYLMALATSSGKVVHGIEAERSGARFAAQKLAGMPGCHVVQASCYALPYPDGYFDAVTLTDVIEHLEHPELCLREIRRVLSPEGLILVTTPLRRAGRPLGWNHVKEYVGSELVDSLSEHFSPVRVIYLWPRFWMRMYSTRIGWRAIRLWCRLFDVNPYLEEGPEEEKYDLILAWGHR